MNVLVIAPHPDDESIGCGGTLRKHADAGDHVTVVFLTSGELGLKHLPPEQAWRIREAEAEAAAEVLGIRAVHFLRLPDWFVGEDIERAATLLRPLLQRAAPARFYLPHEHDAHPDHRAALAVLRASQGPEEAFAAPALAYEVWTPMGEHDEAEDVTSVMHHKLRAIRCHRSQLAVFRYDRAARGLNQYRGALACHTRYAEVFRTVQEAPET